MVVGSHFDTRITAVDADVREHLTTLYQGRLEDNHRLTQLELSVPALEERFEAIERHMPEVLNAIASTNGMARLLRREFEEVRVLAGGDDLRRELEERVDRLDAGIERLDGHVRDELWPTMSKAESIENNAATLAWLVGRVETVRVEMMHEMRYGRAASDDSTPAEVVVVDPEKLLAEEVRLNLGCGHIPIDGFVNVDMRPLPGVDVVAPVDQLPVEKTSVTEIFSAHTLEHFPEEELARTLLPYWYALLVQGGTFRAVVPDLEAMTRAVADGDMEFETYRQVTYGGQEYEGDFHFTGFTPGSLTSLLERAGFDRVQVIEAGRPNGDCLEFEISARRPD